MSNHIRLFDRHEIFLLDGSKASLRLICTEDKPSLLTFHGQLSQETRFLRYQYLKGDLTDQDLKNFCDVDYSNSLALVAEKEQDGYTKLIGVGRYYRLADIHSAEVAFVVQDSEQRKGVGTHLLNYLAKLAWHNDIHYFIAEILKVNARMISIFRKSDPGMTFLTVNGSSCTVQISVAAVIKKVSGFKKIPR